MANLARELFDHASATPDRPALSVNDRAYSYGELAEVAGRVGAWVRHAARQTERPPRVGILAARGIETYASILGACWAGAAYVPLNPRQPASRLAAIIARAGLDAIIADSRGRRHLNDLPIAGTPVLADLTQSDQRVTPPARIDADAPAYIMFTSGTTGAPKGVTIPVAAVRHLIGRIGERYRFGHDDRFAQFAETSFDASVLEMFCAWAAGASVHVVPEGQLLIPTGFIRRHALTVWCSVPVIITALARLGQLTPASLPSLRIACFGGEPLTLAAVRAWRAAAPGCAIDNQYGPTECTVACTCHTFSEPPVLTPGRGTLCIGEELPGLLVEPVDSAGRFLPVGQEGELAVAGPQLASGYLDDPELTARRFPTLCHPRHGTRRWYLTGDLGMRDAAGHLHHAGRIDNQIKILGHRVELEEIDAHLRAVCGTDMVAAVAWPVVDNHASGVVGFVAGGTITAEEIRRKMGERLPAYMAPRSVQRMSALPLSSNGKIDRKALAGLLRGERGQ